MRADLRLTVATDPEVYPPREDTYLLLEALDVRPGERFLEVGTGTGLVALHAAKVARAVATDVNPAAVQLARWNAAANRLPLAVVRCDLLRGLRGPFDVIAFNPPYLVEDVGGEWLERAWAGGSSGEEVAVRFLEEAGDCLSEHGRIYFLVQNRQAGVYAAARERFDAHVVAVKRLFFEELAVLELHRSVGSTDPAALLRLGHSNRA